MIKFRSTDPTTGKTVVGLGLSALNVEYLRAGAPISVALSELGVESDVVVVVFAGEDENSMAEMLNIGADTVIHDEVNRGGG